MYDSGRERRLSGGQSLVHSTRQRPSSRSARTLSHSDDMEVTMADALVSFYVHIVIEW